MTSRHSVQSSNTTGTSEDPRTLDSVESEASLDESRFPDFTGSPAQQESDPRDKEYFITGLGRAVDMIAMNLSPGVVKQMGMLQVP